MSTDMALKLIFFRRIKKSRKREMYIRSIFSKRFNLGESVLAKELRDDPYYHFRYFRMNKENFDEMLALIRDDITRGNNHRFPINAEDKLALTLRYVATGNSQVSLAFNYRISPQSVSLILREVLLAICKKIGPLWLSRPTPETWAKNEEGFRTIWNFPNACGALDGKHVRIQSPKFSGSTFFNYKHHHSIVLMAIADPWYKFTVVDIGASGSQSDGGIYSRSPIGTAMENGSIGIPPPKQLPSYDQLMPHVILADDAFSLKPNVMKPYPGKTLTQKQRIFNYRQSRGRMPVENAFGILAARFRIFHTAIVADMKLIKLIVQCAVVLHNFLMSKKDLNSITGDSAREDSRGNWRQIVADDSGMESLRAQGSNSFTVAASTVRENFTEYFSEVGAVPWQLNRIS